MKFILQVKDPETQNILSEVEYDSIRKIFLHFNGAHVEIINLTTASSTLQSYYKSSTNPYLLLPIEDEAPF